MSEANESESLAELRRQRAEIERARKARIEKEEAANELPRARRELEEAEAVDRFERELGRKAISVVKSDEGIVIVKKPDARAFKRFQDAEKVTTLEVEKLVMPCVIYPDADRFDRMVEEAPGLLSRCGDHVCYLAGIRKDDLEKKS